jgi:hypothetical protein
MRTITHLELLRIDIELTLRSLKPYNKLRDVDNEGNELRFNKETGYFEAVTFKPFWEVV